MGAAERDRHPADAAGDGIEAERPAVQRLDRDAFIETQLAQPPCFLLAQPRPIDCDHAGGVAERQLIKAQMGHAASDYQ
jgi:hypothetical protein